MADCTNEIEIEKNLFHIKDNVFTKLFEFLETLNRTVLILSIKYSFFLLLSPHALRLALYGIFMFN
jgi:hypothetical protein